MKFILTKLGITDTESFWKVVLEFLKFGMVGISNTLISLGIYYVLVYFGIHYVLANTVGFVISVLNSYILNSKFVFKGTEKIDTKKTLIKTFVSYGFTFVLSTILLFIMIDKLNISDKIALLLNLISTVPINFLLNKFWAHK